MENKMIEFTEIELKGINKEEILRAEDAQPRLYEIYQLQNEHMELEERIEQIEKILKIIKSEELKEKYLNELYWAEVDFEEVNEKLERIR